MKTDTNHRGGAEGRREPTALVKSPTGFSDFLKHLGRFCKKKLRSIGLDPSRSVSAH